MHYSHAPGPLMHHEFEQVDAEFETTDWTYIDALRGDAGQRRDEVIEVLIRRYWPPAYAWLRQQNYQHDEAAEITQSFFHEIVLERSLFERADQTRGRLRSLIRAALRHHAADVHRQQSRRPGQQLIPNADLIAEQRAFTIHTGITPDQMYDRRWALACMEQAVEQCEQLYRAAGRLDYWKAFEARVLLPARNNTEPPPRHRLAEQLGFTDEAHVSVVVHMVRQRLRAVLHQVVARTVDEPDQREAEFRLLRELLS